jgi:hypothetical protein
MLNRLKPNLYGMNAEYVISRDTADSKLGRMWFNIEVNLTGEPNLPVVSNSLIKETIIQFLRRYISFTFSDKKIINFSSTFDINYNGKYVDNSSVIESQEFKKYIKDFLSNHKNDTVCINIFQKDGYGTSRLCVKISDLKYNFYNDNEDMRYYLEGTTDYFIIGHPLTGEDLPLTDDIWKRFEEETGEDSSRVKEALIIVFNTKSVDYVVDISHEFLDFVGYYNKIPNSIAENIGWACEFFTSSLSDPNLYPYDYNAADLDHARSAVRTIRELVAND